MAKMRYNCHVCGSEFDNPEPIKDVLDSVSLCGCTEYYYQTIYVCPYCGHEVDEDLNA